MECANKLSPQGAEENSTEIYTERESEEYDEFANKRE